MDNQTKVIVEVKQEFNLAIHLDPIFGEVRQGVIS